MTRSSLGLDELVDCWTLLDVEREQVGDKRGAARLGFALLLKFYTSHGRFPRGRAELPDEAIDFVGRQVQVAAAELGFYEWTGRTIEAHRAQVREHLGFRVCSVADAQKLSRWLATEVCEQERQLDLVREALLGRCRVEQIEPPAAGRVERIVRSAMRTAETALTERITARLDGPIAARIEALVGDDSPDDTEDGADGHGTEAGPVLATIKQSPGNVSLETMLTEIDRLTAVRAIGLPLTLFDDVAPKVAAGWRARAAVEWPSHLREHSPPLRLTLLASLLHAREREITDTLIDLVIATVHRIGARAEKKVTEELVSAFKRVSGKEHILFKVAEAAIAAPDGTVRQVVYPAVAGGEQTLQELVREYKTSGSTYRRAVQTTLRASYSNHYRRGLIALLGVLEFRSSNTAYQPVVDAHDQRPAIRGDHADARRGTA